MRDLLHLFVGVRLGEPEVSNFFTLRFFLLRSRKTSKEVLLLELFGLLDDRGVHVSLELSEDPCAHIEFGHLLGEGLLQRVTFQVEGECLGAGGVIDPLIDPRHHVVQH